MEHTMPNGDEIEQLCAGPQISTEEWGALQEVLQSSERRHLSAGGTSAGSPAADLTAAQAIPIPDLSALPPGASVARNRGQHPGEFLARPPHSSAGGSAAGQPPRLAQPSVPRPRDLHSQPAPALEVQIVKRRTPDGRLANVVQCTEEFSILIDPREVANQLGRLCNALASGALSLNGLGESTSCTASLPLPPCLGNAGGTTAASSGSAGPSTSPKQRASAAPLKAQQSGVRLEMHTCGGSRCECTHRRTLPGRHTDSGRKQNAPVTRTSASGAADTGPSSSFSEGSGIGSGSGNSRDDFSGASPAAHASAANGLITHQSVSADGVLTLRLRPSQPHAVEDPERRKLANTAYIKAQAARRGSAEDSPAESSSEDEDQLLHNLLRRAAAAGGNAAPSAAAAEAVASAAAVPESGKVAAASCEPAQPQQDPEPSAPLGKHESVSRITVEFLDQHGHFDHPIQEAAAQLQVSATTLKKICRAQGIQRWPYRKRNHAQQLLKKSVAMVSRKPKKSKKQRAVGRAQTPD